MCQTMADRANTNIHLTDDAPTEARFSPAEAAFARTQRSARLATADATGCPHTVPICYAFDGQRLYMPLDEKPKRAADAVLRR